jgi:ABC-type multidrug transport system permease subunit
MGNLGLLYRGEMLRMRRYNITAASLVVVVIWIAMLYFAGTVNVGVSLPLVLFADATMMSVLLVSVIMLFEKQEGATRSMLVLPITKGEYLGAKILATVTSSVITLVLLLIYAVGFRGVSANVPGLFGAVLLAASVFCLIGVVLTYRVRDFTSLLMSVFVLFLGLGVPTILEALDVVSGEWLTWLQYLNPMKSALIILSAGVETIPANEIWRSVAYLAGLGAVMAWLAWRHFDAYAAKEIGG